MRRFLAVLALSLSVTPAMAEDVAPPSVSVIAARSGEIVETARVTGTLVAREEVVVGVDVSGLRILELGADAGDVVTEGQLLARLDPATVEIELVQNASQLAKAGAAIAQAEATIAEAKARLVEAQSALNRTQSLKRSGVTSTDVLEQRVSASKVATAQMTAAEQGLAAAQADKAVLEAQRSEIQLRMKKTEIRAQVAGLILSRSAQVGAIVSPASPPLFRIIRDRLVELEAEATELELARFRAGMAVSVLPAGSAETVAGEIRVVWPEIDPKTRLGRLRVALPENPGLRVGAFARGTIETARRTGVLVPNSALQGSGSAVSVLVAADGVVKTRPVEIGLHTDLAAEITRGVAPGELVVLKSGSFLQDGDRITPMTTEAVEVTQ